MPLARLVAADAAPDKPAAAAPDVDRLARQVYAILKAQLRAERDRHQLYGR
jgi:hypothetical protein